MLCATDVWGADYYVDSGISDDNVGSVTPDCTVYNTSTFACSGGSEDAFATIADLNAVDTAGSWAAGDNIYFKKGDRWNGTRLYISDDGEDGNPITFTSFGTGDKPIITGAVDLLAHADCDEAGEWTNEAGDVWSCEFENGTGIYTLVCNDNTIGAEDDGAADTGKDKDGTINAECEWDWQDLATDEIHVYSPDATNPTAHYTSLWAGTQTSAVLVTSAASYIHIDGLDFRNARYSCATVYGDYNKIYNCDAIYNSAAGIYLGDSTADTYLYAYNNDVSYTGREGNQAITTEGDYVYIYNNYVHDNYNEGIDAYLGADHVYIHDNFVDQNDYYAVGIYLDGADNSEVYNNIVTGASYGIAIGDELADTATSNKIYYNIVYDNFRGIFIDQELGGSGTITGVEIYNNIIDFGGATAVGGMSLLSGTGIVAKNNIITDFVGVADEFVLTVHADAVAEVTLDNNLYYDTESAHTLISYGGTPYTTAQWTTYKAAVTPNDANSPDPADPAFVSATDFRIQAGSDALLGGTDVGLSTDIQGKAIHATTPTIGAIEGSQNYYYMNAVGTAADAGSALNCAAPLAMSIATHESEGASVSADDILILCDDGGDYTDSLDTPIAGLIYKSENEAFGSGGYPTFSGAVDNAIHITADDGTEIYGVHITAFTGRGIYATNTDDLIIQRCTISGGDDAGGVPDFGIQVQGTDNVLETGVQIKDNIIGTISGTERDSVLYSGIIVQETSGAVISGNSITTTYTPGIQLVMGAATDSTGTIVENNEISGSASGILMFNTDNGIIRYNHIHDGVGVGIGVAYDSDNAEVYYNLIYNLTDQTTNLWNGIDINHDSQTGTVYNNTVYAVHGNCFVIDDETAACDGWLVKNNIFDASANGSHGGVEEYAWRSNGDGITVTSNYNILYPHADQTDDVFYDGDDDTEGLTLAELQAGGAEIGAQDANSDDADPAFVSATDFHLTSASPAKDVGTDVSLTSDYDGINVPQGAGYDIGAYEYLGTTYIQGATTIQGVTIQ